MDHVGVITAMSDWGIYDNLKMAKEEEHAEHEQDELINLRCASHNKSVTRDRPITKVKMVHFLDEVTGQVEDPNG
jgi:hypothetical protein